ncbi:hypothetical protein [Actinomycetospora sp. NBRC 106378]|jgi:hypothetical protein|uniref:hypothetical protein n=1 Tax=Actinomycetospora sp. NBRC 106378 TaxID=3032208 RepID=UPI0024A1E898|nr:hypothetical protein [Actinomycetospora sp. NBRC 106378]GLZ51205.1 hypothetical protein Acsp07_08220 [Actinomycetospora sp. NBRC 106378]
MADLDRRPRSGNPVTGAARGLLGLVAGIVRFVTGLFAVILALHIVLRILGANPDNGLTQFVANAADSLTLGLANLFEVGDGTVQLVLSYGIPAIAWLVIGAVIVAILRVIARPRSGLA